MICTIFGSVHINQLSSLLDASLKNVQQMTETNIKITVVTSNTEIIFNEKECIANNSRQNRKIVRNRV